MSNRLSFYTHLSSIMEMMARTALTEVCKLVEDDSADLRSELSRVLADNAVMTERLHGLECELTIVRSEVPKLLSKNCRTIGVQAGDTVGNRDCCVIEDPTIEGIFGKEWCMNLWKDRDPYSLERVIHSTQCSEKSVTPLSGPVDVTEIKEEDYEEDIASSCQRETLKLNIGEDEDSVASETGGPSIEYSVDNSTDSPSSPDQEEEQAMAAGGRGEHSMGIISMDRMEGEYTHVIPVDEEDDQDGDIQLIEESQKEPSITTAGEPTKNEQQTSPGNYENITSPNRETGDDFNISNLPTTSDTNQERFTCHVCSRTFFHKGSLTNHMKSHKSNFCQICKQNFPVRSVLKTHVCVPPVRSQGSHHSCELCGKVFANPSAVRVHYVVHTGEKPHVCNLCGKRFTQKGNLKCHLRIHSGERPFRCVSCGKTFTQKVNLNHHLMAHRNSEARTESARNRRHPKS